MVSIVELWEAKNAITKTGTSGYQNRDEFLLAVNSVQKGLINILAPVFEQNIMIQEYLAPFVEVTNLTSNAQGVITKPADHVHFVSAQVNGNPVWPLRHNGIGLSNVNSIRKPDSSNGVYYYTLSNSSVVIYPKAVTAVEYTYIRQPLDANIILTPSSSADSDYLTPTVGQDLEWPERVFNLLLYLVLERFGVEQKEQLITEYSQLGINREIQTLS